MEAPLLSTASHDTPWRVDGIPQSVAQYISLHTAYPHIENTDHLVSQIFIEVLTPIDLLKHPGITAHDDPLAAFGTLLKTIAPLDLAFNNGEKLEVSQEAIDWVKRAHGLCERAPKLAASRSIIYSAVQHPCPPHLEPFELVMPAKAILSTPEMSHKPNTVPLTLSDIYKSNSKHSIKIKVPIPAVKIPPRDIDGVLDMRPCLSEQDAASAKLFRSHCIHSIGKLRKGQPAPGHEKIWEEWEKEFRAELDRIRRELSPPLFPFRHLHDTNSSPDSSIDMRDHASIEQSPKSNVVQRFTFSNHLSPGIGNKLSMVAELAVNVSPNSLVKPDPSDWPLSKQLDRSEQVLYDNQRMMAESNVLFALVEAEDEDIGHDRQAPDPSSFTGGHDGQPVPMAVPIMRQDAVVPCPPKSFSQIKEWSQSMLYRELPGAGSLGAETRQLDWQPPYALAADVDLADCELPDKLSDYQDVLSSLPKAAPSLPPTPKAVAALRRAELLGSFEDPDSDMTILQHATPPDPSWLASPTSNGPKAVKTDQKTLDQIKIIKLPTLPAPTATKPPPPSLETAMVAAAPTREELNRSKATRPKTKRKWDDSSPLSLDDIVRSKMPTLEMHFTNSNLPRLASSFFQLHNASVPGTAPPTLLPTPSPEPVVDRRSHKQDGRQSPVLRNPSWYTKLVDQPCPIDEPIKILVSMRLVRYRSLAKQLVPVFELVEQDQLYGVDLVLSATTAVVFCKLDRLHDDNLLQDLKKATRYYRKVIVVFEVVPYGKRTSGQADPVTDPLTPAVLKALPTLRRAIAGSILPDRDVGQVDLVFPRIGGEEVANVLRNMLEQEFDTLRTSLGGDEAWLICEDRKWLLGNEDDELRVMTEGLGLNPFAAHFILGYSGSAETFAFEYSAEEREWFSAVLGDRVIERCEAQLKARLHALKLSSDGHDTPSSDPLGAIQHDQSAEWEPQMLDVQ